MNLQQFYARKMGDSYKKNKGNAGLEGVQFQLDLLILSFLNAYRSLTNWKVATEDKEAGKYDDIVIKLSDDTAILVQAKHKAKKNITKEQLLSTNPKNSDFSLPKYFFSHLEIKEKFKYNTVIICTNTGIDLKDLKKVVTQYSIPSNNILHYESGGQSFFTFNDNILTDLKASAEIYLDKNLQAQNIDKAVINDQNLKDFLRNLQIIPNYPSESELHKIIERLLPRLNCSSLCRSITYHEIYRKVEEWFKQPKGEYLTETRAKAMFCEIRSDRYCESLKDYHVSFRNNHFDFALSKVFHITVNDGYLMPMLRIYHALQNDSSKKLYVNPEDGAEIQKWVVEAFELRRYTFLVIVWTSSMQWSVISDKLSNILERDRYKKVIFLDKSHSVLVRQIRTEGVEIEGSVTFVELSKESQERLLKSEIIFQGQTVSLKELFHTQPTDNYMKSLNSSMLEKLIKKERIKVGVLPPPSDQDATPYYVNRLFERKVNRRGLKKYSFAEESLYEGSEKLILISDSAGMGKSTFLTRLAVAVKEITPHKWVIRIDLNDYTRFLRDVLRKDSQILNVVELLNSQETTRLTNEFELLVFAVNRKVMLLVDGVDEISPDYTSLVINLLVQCQKSPNFARIFVTTRPHLARDLEEHLKVDSIQMIPFSKHNQVDFLVSYWTHNLCLDSAVKFKCKRYAETLIRKMYSWIKSHYFQDNPFTGIPLQVRILAEIFQENARSREFADWEGCKEYLNGKESEPKLPERIDIARLYNMFIDKKQDVFVDKGNPGGNTAANRALINQFQECLAYHRYLALEEILNRKKIDFFSYRPVQEDMENCTLKIGIVQRSEDKFQFIHQTFAEYFVASAITNELQLHNSNVEFQRLLIDELCVMDEFAVIRTFLNSFLQKVVNSLPSNIFESYQSLVTTYQNSGENLILLLSGEGLIAILQLVLNSVKFEVVKDIEVELSDDREKGNNTLNDLQILVEKAGVNIKDAYGFTPLRRAVRSNQLEMVRFLNMQGANLDSTDIHGYTVLHDAAQRGQTDAVKLLVELGADIDVVDNNNRTPLHLAAIEFHHTIVEYLVERSANVNIKDCSGYTILHLAAKWDWLDIIKRIAVTNDNGYTALHLAAVKKNWATVQYLAECGLDVNVRNSEGITPLQLAAEWGDVATIKRLVEYKADVELKNSEGNSALHIAAKHHELDVMRYLLEQGINVNIKGSEGRTPLHLAMFKTSLDTIKYLVEQGADLELPDDAGNTALHLAAFTGRLSAIEYLVGRGSKVSVTDNYHNTVLHLAVSNGNLDNIEYLVKCGVPVNAKDLNGNTVLHLAAFSGRLDCIKCLVEHGVEVGIENNMGETALQVAESMGHLDVVSYLERVRLGVDS